MHFRQIFGFALLISFGIAQLAAQGAKPIGSGSGSIGGPTTGTTGTATSLPGLGSSTSTTSTTSVDPARPILVTGRVTLEDGAEPGQPVLIERICSGRPHAEGYTDPTGSFSLRLGQEIDVIADASEAPSRNTTTNSNPAGGGMRDRDLATCDLRAVLSGYQSPNISLAAHKYMDNPDIGTIIMHRLGAVEGLTMSATTALAPKDARKSYEKGIEDVRKSKFEEAQKAFEKAVGIYPKFAAAWYELGHVQDRTEHPAEARNSYAQSIAADPKYINPYEGLSIMAFREAKWQEVADNSDRVLHLDPYDYPGAYYYNAVANLQLKNLRPAEKSARTALKFGAANVNPQVYYVLGIILAQKHDYPGAAEALRTYLKVAPDAKDSDKVRKQLGDIEQTVQARASAQQP